MTEVYNVYYYPSIGRATGALSSFSIHQSRSHPHRDLLFFIRTYQFSFLATCLAFNRLSDENMRAFVYLDVRFGRSMSLSPCPVLLGVIWGHYHHSSILAEYHVGHEYRIRDGEAAMSGWKACIHTSNT